MNKSESWIKIAANIDEIDFKGNNIACVHINGKSVCLIKTGSGLKACSSKCPHAGGDLSAGFLDKRENIICPVHNYRFNLNNGRDINGEGYFLKIFDVREDVEGVFVKIA